MNCTTCNNGRNPTRFALVPSLSDATADVAVQMLGAALCSRCYPDAPVEMVEQSRITASVATVLLQEGEEAFQIALAKSREKASQRAATKCAGSGKIGREGRNRWWIACTECNYSHRPPQNSDSRKVRSHAAPKPKGKP